MNPYSLLGVAAAEAAESLPADQTSMEQTQPATITQDTLSAVTADHAPAAPAAGVGDAPSEQPAAAGQPVTPVAEEWPPLDRVTYAPLPCFPLEALPSPLREQVEQIAAVYQVPIEVPALGSLVVAGLACGPRHEVEVKMGLKSRANLYVIGFLPSGLRKSSIFPSLTQPLREFADERSAEWEVKCRQIRLWQACMASRERALATVGLTAEGAACILAEIEVLKTKKPTGFSPLLVLSNATEQYVQVRLMKTDERAAVLSADSKDELDLIRGSSRAKGGDSIFLNAYTGEPVDLGRISRAEVALQHPALSLFLLTQDHQLQMLAAAPHLHQSGFLPRCIKLVPDDNVGERWFNASELDPQITRNYCVAIRRVLERTFGDQERVVYRLTPAAEDLWVDFYNLMEARMGNELRQQRAEAIRWADLPLRFALSMAMLRGAAQVNEEDMGAGIKLQQYLEHHAARAHQTMRTGLSAEGARIVQYVSEHNLHEFTLPALRRALGNVLAKTLATQLLALTEAGYLRPMGAGKHGVYLVNPQVWQVIQ